MSCLFQRLTSSPSRTGVVVRLSCLTKTRIPLLMSADTTPHTSHAVDDTSFERTMKARHLIMLSLGGVIGTGLFFQHGLCDR